MKRYFVTSVYRPCGAKKMEDALYDIAKRNYENTIIHEDRLPAIAASLETDQQEILSQNRRLQPVEIKLWPVDHYIGDGHRTITMGHVHIQMQEVLAEFK